ncbi:MAG TPA: sigma-70 family RNA polymerase sigma factor [Caulobacteraceae bacterium]|nr:sigma-70 family RNA polymerase sigma factor [Caulobacteraceae bacterium]
MPERPLDTSEGWVLETRRFERLVLPHLDAAWRLARWLTRNEADAEDLVQEAYVRAWRFFSSLRGDDAKPWLMRIVRNCWYSRARTEAGRGRATSLEDAEAEVEAVLQAQAEPDGAEHRLIRIEDTALVRRAMDGLPDEFREVLVLREVEDMAYRDLAETVGVPIGTVMSRLSRARKLLGERVRRLSEEAGHGSR